MCHAKVIVYAADESNMQAAKRLAEHLHASLFTERPATQEKLILKLDKNGLALTDGRLELREDFRHMLPRLRQQNLEREYLVKAARVRNASRPLSAVDATAGLGEDSLLLAAKGFSVKLYESDPVIAALLADALRRAAEDPDLAPITARMTLYEKDSIPAMQHLEEKPDIVLLDPMFPAREKSALVKKKFQLLQQLESPCSDETALLHAAQATGTGKIIIKRPLRGPVLGDVKPSYSIKGKAIRYDCIVQ